MNILIVGNILKDTYLNLDTRTEKFEQDKHHTKWLNLSFNASDHRYYNRHSSLGGAVVSMQVFDKLGIDVSISGSSFNLNDNKVTEEETKAHRYILVSDDNTCYFAPSNFEPSTFVVPTTHVDYLYIDRSATITQETATEIATFLENSPKTKLIVYYKDFNNPYLVELSGRATIIFTEEETVAPADFDKTIFVSETKISFKDISEPISIDRIDRLTHLSAYSVTAATIIGSFILGNTIEKSLKMARANIESSNLDSVLSLDELNSIIATPTESLELVAASLVAPKKGILAADESGGSIKKKFSAMNIEDSFENRHDYRNIFFTAPNLEDYISGVILFDETARDYADNGQTYTDFLISHRIIPGIKVDQGLAPLNELLATRKEYNNLDLNNTETYTKGLIGLPERLREYYEMGLRFAKWRAAFNLVLSENGDIVTPTEAAIVENCRILAEYAKDCQSAGLVPIVEPELVYDGKYPIEKCAEVTGHILDVLFEQLDNFGVVLNSCILKTNMVLAGKQNDTQSTPEEVGKKTADVLKNHVPKDLAGVVFLSGGQTPEQATANLAEIKKQAPFPWPVTFSFARAIQDPALFAWSGNNDNVDAARQAFVERIKLNTEVL